MEFFNRHRAPRRLPSKYPARLLPIPSRGHTTTFRQKRSTHTSTSTANLPRPCFPERSGRNLGTMFRSSSGNLAWALIYHPSPRPSLATFCRAYLPQIHRCYLIIFSLPFPTTRCSGKPVLDVTLSRLSTGCFRCHRLSLCLAPRIMLQRW